MAKWPLSLSLPSFLALSVLDSMRAEAAIRAKEREGKEEGWPSARDERGGREDDDDTKRKERESALGGSLAARRREGGPFLAAGRKEDGEKREWQSWAMTYGK